MNIKRIFRARIDQPSTQQPLHIDHGKVGIAVEKENGDLTIYFAEGSIISMCVLPTQIVEVRQ